MSKAKLLFELHKRNGFQFDGTGKKNTNLQTTMLNAFKMTPENAFKYLQGKGGAMAKSWSYKAMSAEAHQKAFTVAKVMEADLLQDIYDEILKSKKDGIPLSEFRKNLEPKLQSRGWIGGQKEQIDPNTGESKLVKLTPNRLKVIYDTNMQTSFSQGKYKQQMLLGERYPILVYKQVQRHSKRKDHAKFHNKAFRYDDPIIKKIYPPSDYSCHCSIIQMSEKEAEAKGYKVGPGSDYEDIVKNGKEFNIQSVDAWEPDTTKYVEGIKRELEAALKPVAKEIDDLDYKLYKPMLADLVAVNNRDAINNIIKYLAKNAKNKPDDVRKAYQDLIDEYKKALADLKAGKKPVVKPVEPNPVKQEPVVKAKPDKPIEQPKAPVVKNNPEPIADATAKPNKVKFENKKIGVSAAIRLSKKLGADGVEGKKNFGNKYITTKVRENYLNSLDKTTQKNLEGYMGVDYGVINEALRTNNTVNAYYKKGANLMKNDLNHEFKGSDGPVLFRGEKYIESGAIQKRIDDLLKHDTYKMNMLHSASADVDIATKFGKLDNPEYNSIVYKINMPERYKAGFGTAYESEIILRKEARLKITKVTDYEVKLNNGTITHKFIIEAEYLGE